MSTRKHAARKSSPTKSHKPAVRAAVTPQDPSLRIQSERTLAEPPPSIPMEPGSVSTPAHSDEPAVAPLAPLVAPSLIPEGPFVPIVTRALGASYGEYPKFMDEVLERSLVTAIVLRGTGSQVIELDAPPLAVHAGIVGVEGAGTTFQVTTNINTDGNVVVSASAGITWSVLVLLQRGDT